MNNQKGGFIKVSNDIFMGQPNLIREIYKTFYPIHIEYRIWENHIWFLFGYCDYFEEIKNGEKWLQYDVTFTEKEDKSFDLKFTAYK